MFSSPARRTRLWPFALVAVIAVVVGLWFGGHPGWLPGPLRSVFVQRSAQERQIEQVLSLLSKDYYRPVDTQKLVNMGLAAAVASLDDPYSHYYPPTEYHAFLRETNPQVSGIGVEVNTVPAARGLQIVEVYPGSPAAHAGLVHGDIVTAVGSTKLAGKSTIEDSNLIRGRAGTSVTLTILHHGHTRQVTVVRRNIVVPVAASELLHYRGHRVGYLEFSQFAEGSADELRAQVRKMLHAGAQGLVLDLRANPGGLLEEAIKVASLFIPDGTIVTTRGRNQPTTVYTALPGYAVATKIPMVVLVDRGTASSAEIVTGALKDRGRATVVGTRTYGKGVFQQIQSVTGGGALDITVGEYFTPNGQNLGAPGVAQGHSVAEGRGIAPNVYVFDNPQDPGTKALRVAERVLVSKLP